MTKITYSPVSALTESPIWLVAAVVGGLIGFAVGGPLGAPIGLTIGGLVGFVGTVLVAKLVVNHMNNKSMQTDSRAEKGGPQENTPTNEVSYQKINAITKSESSVAKNPDQEKGTNTEVTVQPQRQSPQPLNIKQKVLKFFGLFKSDTNKTSNTTSHSAQNQMK